MVQRADLEAVWVATPTNLHLEHATIALEAGKHVLCTKPMTRTLAEADRMITASQRSRMRLAIGFQCRYDSRIYKAKRMIDQGRLGKILFGIDYLPGWREENYWSEAPWRATEAGGGGIILTSASHDLDYFQWFLGPVDWVMARKETVLHHVEVEDSYSAAFKFKSGAIVTFVGTLAAINSKGPRFEIFGNRGVLTLAREPRAPGRPNTLLFSTGKEWKTIAGSERVSSPSYWKVPKWSTGISSVPSVNALVRNAEEFIDCIIEDREPLVPVEEGRKSVEMSVAIGESSREGKMVHFPLTA
jgi:predicted dehydrogenase